MTTTKKPKKKAVKKTAKKKTTAKRGPKKKEVTVLDTKNKKIDKDDVKVIPNLYKHFSTLISASIQEKKKLKKNKEYKKNKKLKYKLVDGSFVKAKGSDKKRDIINVTYN